ncbi:MAG: hypothetical protein H0X26_06025 [Alphaproteobacteria bacterium]|nr:hypothetical protein [Alphaproteobacteria bacterium]
MSKSLKKYLFFCLTLASILVNAPTLAMEIDKDAPDNVSRLINLGDITPVKDGMTSEEAKSAIQSFFQKEVFTQQNEISWKDFCRVDTRTSPAGRNYTLITLNDGTKWVFNEELKWSGGHYEVRRHGLAHPDGIQRFLGALYLKKAINSHSLTEEWRAVDTKFLLINPMDPINIRVEKSAKSSLKNIFTIESQDFISLSRYVGEEKPTTTSEQRFKLNKLTSYCDLIANVNLRKEGSSNIITIIDTAYDSFYNDKLYSYEKYIDSTLLTHDEYFAENYIVNAPSQQTEQEIGGATFSFSRAQLSGS